jgi:hypothetical protein
LSLIGFSPLLRATVCDAELRTVGWAKRPAPNPLSGFHGAMKSTHAIVCLRKGLLIMKLLREWIHPPEKFFSQEMAQKVNQIGEKRNGYVLS